MSAGRSTPLSPKDLRAKSLIEKIERVAPQALAFVVVCVADDRLAAAASRPFWNDEVITWALARQPSASTSWNALAHAADTQSPLYYLVCRVDFKPAHRSLVAFDHRFLPHFRVRVSGCKKAQREQPRAQLLKLGLIASLWQP
jgi:hypothetical protein